MRWRWSRLRMNISKYVKQHDKHYNNNMVCGNYKIMSRSKFHLNPAKNVNLSKIKPSIIIVTLRITPVYINNDYVVRRCVVNTLPTHLCHSNHNINSTLTHCFSVIITKWSRDVISFLRIKITVSTYFVSIR